MRGLGRMAMVALLLAHGSAVAGGCAVEMGPAAAKSAVPRWDARGLGALPWQGVACLDVSDDGRFVAVGTIAPPGDPNLFLLDENGKLVEQHEAGRRWLNEVSVAGDGSFVAALCTTPEGTAGDSTRLYAFLRGKELAQVGSGFKLRDFRPGGFLFHYGGHSNHLPRVARWAGDRWVVAGDDRLFWLSPTESGPAQVAHLGAGVTTAFAASPNARVAVGRLVEADAPNEKAVTLYLLEAGRPGAVWWRHPGIVSGSDVEPGRHSNILQNVGMSLDAAPAPQPEKGLYGPAVPPYRDAKSIAPLSVAIATDGAAVAAAVYQGWQRRFGPGDGGHEVVFGLRFMPSRPTVHVYAAEGKLVRRVGPEAFREPFWADLAFSTDGRKLLIFPHNWTSRGLAGQSLLPADEQARDLYVLDLASGDLDTARFPDAISSVAPLAGGGAAVGCWDGRAYLLDKALRPLSGVPKGLDVGGPSLVRASQDGKRIAVATTAGTVLMLDPSGKELWRTDLNQAAKPGEKPWTKNQKPGKLAAGLWRTNGGLAHSDMGGQYLVEAPEGLLLIDPNSGLSFEQNWAKIQGAGLDPMQVKYVLLTHEHGDHAPGSYLWRVVTGAQVVAGAETACILQHHLPGGTGYGFHPPNPVDIVVAEDRELDLAGLKVKALRLPGHTYGSMGYAFAREGKTFVATGDLIMPGGVLGYSGSLDFSAQDVLASLRKLAALKPDAVIGGHGGGAPDGFIAAGIEAGEATGWSRMKPEKPNPLYRFSQTNYLVAAWLQPILSAAYGDVDGDGRPDVAILAQESAGPALRIYLNKGGRFEDTPDMNWAIREVAPGWKLRLLHVNADKVADFFVSSEGQAAVLLSQDRQLHFFFHALPVTRGTQALTGDFDGDGRTDLVIGGRFVGGCSIAHQRAANRFRLSHLKSPERLYFDIALADVNGDKREDLIASSGEILLRQADGSLADTPAFRLGPPNGEPAGWAFMAAADFDGDGWSDVALLANGNDGAVVWLYRNTRNPAEPFPKEPSAAFTVPGAAVLRDGPTVADWNGDGVPDLVLCSRGNEPAARILLGGGTDGLSRQRVPVVKLDYMPHFDTRLGVADFDGDGRADLAGFGPSPVGAVGVYIWLQRRER